MSSAAVSDVWLGNVGTRPGQLGARVAEKDGVLSPGIFVHVLSPRSCNAADPSPRAPAEKRP
jgi:hypothetical protein